MFLFDPKTHRLITTHRSIALKPARSYKKIQIFYPKIYVMMYKLHNLNMMPRLFENKQFYVVVYNYNGYCDSQITYSKYRT
jgi:hypothetical protein